MTACAEQYPYAHYSDSERFQPRHAGLTYQAAHPTPAHLSMGLPPPQAPGRIVTSSHGIEPIPYSSQERRAFRCNGSCSASPSSLPPWWFSSLHGRGDQGEERWTHKERNGHTKGAGFAPAPRDVPSMLNRSLRVLIQIEALAEALHAPGGIEDALLAREERVTLRAHVHTQLRLGAAHRKGVATGARDGRLDVLRMNSGFHMFTPAAPTAAVLARGTCLSDSKRVRRHAHPTIVSRCAPPGKRACGPPAPAVDSTVRGGRPTRTRRAPRDQPPPWRNEPHVSLPDRRRIARTGADRRHRGHSSRPADQPRGD